MTVEENEKREGERTKIIREAVQQANRIIMDGSDGSVEETNYLTACVAEQLFNLAINPVKMALLSKDIDGRILTASSGSGVSLLHFAAIALNGGGMDKPEFDGANATPGQWDKHKHKRFLELYRKHPDLVRGAVAFLADRIGAAAFSYRVQIEKSPTWFAKDAWHFHQGMGWRNLLRDAGFGEVQFGCHLDDCYVELIECAVGCRPKPWEG